MKNRGVEKTDTLQNLSRNRHKNSSPTYLNYNLQLDLRGAMCLKKQRLASSNKKYIDCVVKITKTANVFIQLSFS